MVAQQNAADPVFISPAAHNRKELVMRRTPAMLGLLVVGLIDAGPSSGQEFRHYPWCLFTGGSEGGIEMCSFDSFEQCLLSRSGGGGICFANPAYSGAEPPAVLTEPPAAATAPQRQTPRRSNERRRT